MSTEEWGVGYDEGYMKGWNDAMDEKPAEASEPVAYIDHRIHAWPDCFVMQPDPPHTTPLYTTPPQRKPLTEQEIVDLCDGTLTTWEQVRIARAIEAAHGIKENT